MFVVLGRECNGCFARSVVVGEKLHGLGVLSARGHKLGQNYLDRGVELG